MKIEDYKKAANDLNAYSECISEFIAAKTQEQRGWALMKLDWYLLAKEVPALQKALVFINLAMDIQQSLVRASQPKPNFFKGGISDGGFTVNHCDVDDDLLERYEIPEMTTYPCSEPSCPFCNSTPIT